MNNTHLSSRVGRLNLDWTDPDQSSEKENEAFQRAMALAGTEFLDVSVYSLFKFYHQTFALIEMNNCLHVSYAVCRVFGFM